MGFGVDLFWPAYGAFLLVVLALGLHVAAYRRTTRPVSNAVRRFLLGIRLAAVALLVLALWRPAAETREKLERKARLVVLVDASKSMSIGDESPLASSAGVSRLQRAAGVFTENRALWEKITASAVVEGYTFARGLAPLPAAPAALASGESFGVTPVGEVTALGDALREAASAQSPQSVLVISDGLSNAGVAPLDAVAAYGAPIYSISVGSERPGDSTRDAAAVGIFAPSEAFEGSEISIVGEFSLTGLAGRRVQVSLYAGGDKVQTTTLTAGSDQELVEAPFTHTPEEVGPLRLEVVAEPLADEIVALNNSAATYIDIRHGGMKVLYIEGGFRWEAKFLRSALEALRDVQLRFLVPLGNAGEEIAAALDEEWDVVIIGSLAASKIPRRAGDALRDAVSKEGVGLLFLAGPQALGSGGYGTGALGGLCPFELSEDELFDPCLWAPEPHPLGPHGDIVTFGSGKETAPWEGVPALLAVNLVGEARPGASVLLSAHPKKRNETTGRLEPCPLRTEAPLFAVQEYGGGRTAAFAGEGTWQWVMGSGIEDEARRKEAALLHARFWRQVVFWLARREERGAYTVALELDRHRAAVGETLGLRAKFLDERMEGVTDAALRAVISTGDTVVERTFWVEGNGYRVDFEPALSGDYTVRVTATRAGAELAEARSAFIAVADDIELATLVARPSLLAALSLATGGRYAAADNAGYVLSELAENATSSTYMRLKRRELWSSWYYLALILALLTLEWGIRKLAGLI